MEELKNDHNSSLLLKPSSNVELLVNQFKNATLENNNDPEKISRSKYYDIDFVDRQHLFSSTKTFFDIIAVSETRITK